MKPNDFVKLEKDYPFRRGYLKETLWWKNAAFIAPVLILFVGLAGILYLFRNNSLVSLYIIPYLLLFVAGTIWLKAVKRYIQKNMMDAPGSFLICLAKPIGEKDGYVYTVFVNDNKRHDKYYISNLADDLSFESFSDNSVYKKKSVMNTDEDGKEFFVRAYPVRDVNKRNSTWREDNLFAVLFIDEKSTPVVKKRDLMELQNKK